LACALNGISDGLPGYKIGYIAGENHDDNYRRYQAYHKAGFQAAGLDKSAQPFEA
jgi:hypothetical protein